jgi:hypothetical protein
MEGYCAPPSRPKSERWGPQLEAADITDQGAYERRLLEVIANSEYGGRPEEADWWPPLSS